ncbi:uncharacterized protein CDAR_192631 [Caerostris darwini]|uniref:Uncharacterized protein n=1 Tax=Caerostris darwini TaxID=1538125 RepID=A0AAV4S7X3_9ARAC|nr:uncharacterized protein CDAR_192631 [Caerostris darwini]
MPSERNIKRGLAALLPIRVSGSETRHKGDINTSLEKPYSYSQLLNQLQRRHSCCFAGILETATARGKSEQADISAMHAQEDGTLARQIAKQFDPDIKVPDMMKNKYPDRMNPTPPARIPFTNLSNQTLSADTPDGSRTDSPLDRLSGRTMSMASPTQQERYMSPTPVIQTQFPGQQSAVTMNQTPYAKQNAVHQDSRYFPPQQQQQQQPIDQRYGPQQPPSQLSYGSQSQGYGGYPPQPQYPAQKTSYLSAQQDPPVVPNRQGSFRRRPSGRDPQGGYTMQQAMGDHFDHYRQEPPRIRTVIKHGRRIPSPPRSGMYPPAPRTSYGPDATPDSGVSESMDELSPSRFGRKSHLPPLIYGDSHASSLLSFAPSEEDRRSMSPTMSSAGLDSELGSEASTGSGAFPRTASLYVNPPSRRKEAAAANKGGDLLMRKKSMPHGPKEMPPQKVIPREEVAYLSSQRREELRRMQYESERLRSNPLLYLVRPDLKVSCFFHFPYSSPA